MRSAISYNFKIHSPISVDITPQTAPATTFNIAKTFLLYKA